MNNGLSFLFFYSFFDDNSEIMNFRTSRRDKLKFLKHT